MSTEIANIKSNRTSAAVGMTQFSGGSVRGLCLQLTQSNMSRDKNSTFNNHFFNNIQLTKDQALVLAGELFEWAVSNN